MAESPEGEPRFAARSGYVGGGRVDAPVPHEGPGGTAVHLPAILRTLHAHGSGGERRATGGETEVPDPAERPLPADAGLPSRYAFGARRGGERRGHRQHPDRN